MNEERDAEIDNFIRSNIGQYWDSTENLAKALKEEFGEIYTDDQWYWIASAGIMMHYT